ncbi:hypothetical protein C4565_02685 [Candidatus Parcubacteria bacterium]|jgi:hypothetical protein|nr:MAG: hypothetical protein C4565_02685 [Candidatus Parcubacteria bacterium]
MDIFKTRTYTWWQVALIKITLLFIGIGIGSYWAETFYPIALLLIVIGLVIGIYLAVITLRK